MKLDELEGYRGSLQTAARFAQEQIHLGSQSTTPDHAKISGAGVALARLISGMDLVGTKITKEKERIAAQNMQSENPWTR